MGDNYNDFWNKIHLTQPGTIGERTEGKGLDEQLNDLNLAQKKRIQAIEPYQNMYENTVQGMTAGGPELMMERQNQMIPAMDMSAARQVLQQIPRGQGWAGGRQAANIQAQNDVNNMTAARQSSGQATETAGQQAGNLANQRLNAVNLQLQGLGQKMGVNQAAQQAAMQAQAQNMATLGNLAGAGASIMSNWGKK